MNDEFRKAVEALKTSQESFNRRAISSVDHAHARGSAICAAVHQLAASFGVVLNGPTHIDSRGDISVVVVQKYGTPHGIYGADFAELLNTARPRTGMHGYPAAHLDERSNWCFLNHFDAERLVLGVYQESEKIAH